MENKYTDNRGLLYTQKATLNAQLYLNFVNKLSLDKLGLSLAFLTLYLLSGHEVMTIHIFTYIIRLFSLQGQILLRKRFRVPFLRQGSFFKINERNISEATELCEGSKRGFLRMANTTRPFPDV